jgi:SnoaL-like domain
VPRTGPKYARTSHRSRVQPGDTPAHWRHEDFAEFLPRFEQGIERFLNGDATLWKSNASHDVDGTIMGAWGDYEKSWVELEPRYDWAAARFEESGATVQIQYLSSGVSGDLAYTVAIESSMVRIVGQKEPAAMSLHVTHLFRKEQGGWKLLHRHADALMSKTPAVDKAVTDLP